MKHLNLTLVALLFSFASYAVIGPIIATSGTSACQGGTIPLSDTTIGGVWTSSSPSVASIGSTSGTVTGVSAGSATITYTKGASFVTTTVFINALPTPYTLYLAGSGGICAGGPGVHIYLSYGVIGCNYQLYLGSSPVGGPIMGSNATLDFGPMTTPGTYTAIGTNTTTGCINNMLGTATLTILPTPAAIGGPSGVCVGSTVSLTDATGGGIWSSSNPAAATIGSTGTVTGIATGTTVVSYTATSGCAAATTINVVNLLGPVTGSTSACTGSATILSDASTGGTWTSANPAVATIGSASGIVTGVATGTTAISYTVGGTCGAVGTTITAYATPASVTGITSICGGAVSTLHDTSPGGVWSSGNTAVATIGSASGIANGVSAGTAPMSYTVAGCSATTNLTVDPPPVISGPTSVCVTSFITLHTTINGSWTSSNPGVASVVTSFMAGTVTGVYPGTAIMTCNSYSTGCVSTYTVTVTSACSGTPTAGTAHASLPTLCSGSPDLLYLTGASTTCGIAYQWQSSTDSLGWGDIAGLTTDSATVHPQANLYYRCKLTCFLSGFFAYSAGVHVVPYNSITAHSVINTPSSFCNGPDMQVSTCGVSPNSNIKTWYGDGTSDSTHIYSSAFDSSTVTDIFHTYNLPGTYTVKQVLCDGITPQDSFTFSFNYNYCRTLPINFYFDANSNCVYDYGDGIFYKPVTTEVDSNGIPIDTITAINGFYYNALGGAGTIYGFRVIGYDTGLHMECPATGILYDTISSFVNTYTAKYFAFICNSSTSFNLGIATSLTCGRHVADGYINVNNTFCNPQSPVVTMTFSNKYNFSSSWPAPFSVVGNTVTWHLPPVSVYTGSTYGWPYIWFELTVPGPFLVTGDTVNSNYKVTPYAGDIDTSNNYVARVDTIMASYDPNRMSVSPRGYVISCTPLQYTINFENTGNDTAHNISVIDTLPDNVDPHTIKLLAASSVVNITIMKAGAHTLAKFDLPGINLLDSSHHNQCNGAVVFTVNANQGLADGSTIFNHASIYFDDNLPVLTNTVENITGISPITGPANVCNTEQIQLNDESENGAWSSSNANATVSSGLATGMAAGADTIKYMLSNSCATKTATMAITINPVAVPVVTIGGTGDSICSEIIPTFIASAINGGTAPTYEWKVNGTMMGAGDTFSYVSPANMDAVSVTMTSNADCAIPDTAATAIVLTVLTPYTPPIALNAYPGIYIPPGTADTFVATVTGSGPTPTFQWLLNGVPIAGATSDTFTSSTLANNDSITCVATGTDYCKLSTFNSFIITVGITGIKDLHSKGAFVLFPNPNNGRFTIRGNTGNQNDEEMSIEVTNMLGQVVYRNRIVTQRGSVNEQIQPDNTLSKGMYLLNLQSGDERVVFHFVVE